MTDSETLAAASRLYVRLRQSAGRVIDAVWMTQNADYAREILRLARINGDAELVRLADRLESMMAELLAPPPPPPQPRGFNPGATGSFKAAAVDAPQDEAAAAKGGRYLYSLR
ncbi:MAG TPA: hypothetical protein VGE57_15120 [Solimonas sp.]